MYQTSADRTRLKKACICTCVSFTGNMTNIRSSDLHMRPTAYEKLYVDLLTLIVEFYCRETDRFYCCKTDRFLKEQT